MSLATDALRDAQRYLAGHGSPLVYATADRVIVCKEGTWADGPDIAAAIEALQTKLGERRAALAENR